MNNFINYFHFISMTSPLMEQACSAWKQWLFILLFSQDGVTGYMQQKIKKPAEFKPFYWLSFYWSQMS